MINVSVCGRPPTRVFGASNCTCSKCRKVRRCCRRRMTSEYRKIWVNCRIEVIQTRQVKLNYPFAIGNVTVRRRFSLYPTDMNRRSFLGLSAGAALTRKSFSEPAPVNKRERMLRWLAGESTPNYTPAAFFLHFGNGYSGGLQSRRRPYQAPSRRRSHPHARSIGATLPPCHSSSSIAGAGSCAPCRAGRSPASAADFGRSL